MAKRPHALSAKRRNYRVPRADSEQLGRVFDVINGDVYRPERFAEARKDITEVLRRTIRHCDAIEEALAGILRLTDDKGVEHVHELKTRDERIAQACQMALRFGHLFSPISGRRFQVMVIPRLEDSTREILGKKTGPYRKELSRTTDESGRPVQWEYETVNRRPGAMPDAEDLFRLGSPLLWPDGDVEVQLYWEFIQGMSALDDLRRIRVCEHCGKFHLRKKVERQPHYFCVNTDECRKAFHNQKDKEKDPEQEKGIPGGSIRSRKTKE